MKKILLFIIILFCSAAQIFSQNLALVNYQTPGNYYSPGVTAMKIGYSSPVYHGTPVNQSDNSDKPVSFGFYFNPVGFIMFGPMVGMEFIINSRFIIDVHYRNPLGLLSYVVAIDDEEWPEKVGGFGFGGGFKYLTAAK